MLYLISALVPCLSLTILMISINLIIKKNSGQVRLFKFSNEGIEIRFDKDKADSAKQSAKD